jgi:hypothetical protein
MLRVMTDASVLVCRGCCCGSSDKHPGIDHGGHYRILAGAAAAGGLRVRVTDCLGCCERSNVVVVRAGTDRHWFAGVLDDEAVEALAAWLATGLASSPPAVLAARAFRPSDGPKVIAQALPVEGDGAAAVVHDLLAAGAPWTVGVPGALADSGRPDPDGVVRRPDDTTVEAVTATSGLRVRLTPAAGLFALAGPDAVAAVMVAARRESLAPPAPTLTARGADRAAIDPAHRGGRLYDLGLAHVASAFCMRTDDDEIQVALDAVVGTPWRDVLDGEVGALLVARSPARVVESGAARAEVTSPIPPPGGESPTGAHTHLDQGLLELNAELPVGIVLPAGWAPAAFFLVPPGWRLPSLGGVPAWGYD